MGLDVYLYWYRDQKATEEREQKYEDRVEELYQEIDQRDPNRKKDHNRLGKWTEAEDEEYKKRRVELAAALGLQTVDDWKKGLHLGEDLPSNKRQIELQSVRHPKEGLFKIGYFRSSYNDGGINHVVPNAIGGDGLHDLFPRDGDDYCFLPDWGESLRLTAVMKEQYLAHLRKHGQYRVSSINPFSLNGLPGQKPQGVSDEHEAMNVFLQQLEKKNQEQKEVKGKGKKKFMPMDEYSNKDGEFFLGKKPLQVRAIMHGTALRGKGVGVYIVYEIPSKGAEQDPYYIYLDVVAETCEWVLNQKDPQNYYLHWSG